MKPSSTSSETESSSNDDFKTWVEKYRPSKLDDVIYQNEIIHSLNNIIKDNACNLPNFLFYGPPGTGKTSTIIALSKQIFKEHYKTRVLELNASDERGIKVIREKVKNFAQQTVSNTINNIPAIKIIVLDECDSMTKDAQSALRRIMEKYTATTRFCLICNYVSKIIDPIVSRCTIFRFKPLRNDLIKSTLINVCQKEGFTIDDDALETLIEISEGDLRKAITLLQTLSLIGEDKKINIDDIVELSGMIPQRLINDFFKTCQSKSHTKMINQVDDIIKAGYSGQQFLNQLQEWIALADNSLLNDNQKSSICHRIALNDKRLLDGCDEFLQLSDVGSCIIKNLKNPTMIIKYDLSKMHNSK